MDIDSNTRLDGEPHDHRFQFSLRTMFIVTTVVAVWCSGLFAPYAVARYLTLALWVFTVPMALIVMVIYARGYMRTFAIGGLFTTFPLLLFHIYVTYTAVAIALSWDSTTWDSVFSMEDNADALRFGPGICCAVYTAVIFLFGFLAMGVRWIVESPQRAHARQSSVPPPHYISEPVVDNSTQESEIAAG